MAFTDDVRPPNAGRARGKLRPVAGITRRVGVRMGWGGFVVPLSEEAIGYFRELCEAHGVLTHADAVLELEAALARGLRDRALEIDARTAVLVFRTPAAATLQQIAKAKGVSFDEAACELYNAGLEIELPRLGGAS